MEDKTAKIRLKVGPHEFEAEGPPEAIQEQYQAFLKVIGGYLTLAVAPPPEPPEKPPLKGSEVGKVPDPENGVTSQPVDRDTLRRVFTDKGPLLSLLALPKTETSEADALLLLLYGYHEMRQSEYPVTGVRMMQAAKQSGLHSVDRIDRTIDAHEKYVNVAGSRRGRKYSLNNQGLLKAQEIMKVVLSG